MIEDLLLIIHSYWDYTLLRFATQRNIFFLRNRTDLHDCQDFQDYLMRFKKTLLLSQFNGLIAHVGGYQYPLQRELKIPKIVFDKIIIPESGHPIEFFLPMFLIDAQNFIYQVPIQWNETVFISSTLSICI